MKTLLKKHAFYAVLYEYDNKRDGKGIDILRTYKNVVCAFLDTDPNKTELRLTNMELHAKTCLHPTIKWMKIVKFKKCQLIKNLFEEIQP